MTALRDLRVAPRQGFAGRHEQLRANKIETGDAFGDRMLDLEARVHLQKEERRAPSDQELDGAGVPVVGGARDVNRRARHPVAKLGVRIGEGLSSITF